MIFSSSSEVSDSCLDPFLDLLCLLNRMGEKNEENIEKTNPKRSSQKRAERMKRARNRTEKITNERLIPKADTSV